MKKFKTMLASLALVITLMGTVAPVIVRADEPGGPQGTSDSRSRQSQSSSEGNPSVMRGRMAKQSFCASSKVLLQESHSGYNPRLTLD
ncbi:MAG: hypothetical protein LC776_11155 [Acidobacteria bacterium]|nr:hypothetical protein [Acidobacteriota bacterium]